jgi:hypothetical protein
MSKESYGALIPVARKATEGALLEKKEGKVFRTSIYGRYEPGGLGFHFFEVNPLSLGNQQVFDFVPGKGFCFRNQFIYDEGVSFAVRHVAVQAHGARGEELNVVSTVKLTEHGFYLSFHEPRRYERGDTRRKYFLASIV